MKNSYFSKDVPNGINVSLTHNLLLTSIYSTIINYNLKIYENIITITKPRKIIEILKITKFCR